MSRLAVILGALLLAGLCYAFGLRWQAFVLVGLGMLFEGVFWVNLLAGGREHKEKAGPQTGPE
ncbi:MAG: hypothetical protein R3200_03020 [Xanthomonadales bacterium]|nr:hypothetical protein [Xanthomonadales bacterium]